MKKQYTRKYDETFMDNIDTEEKGYLLGWIASDGTTIKTPNTIILAVSKNENEFLEMLCDVVCDYSDILPHNKTNSLRFVIHSKRICESVCRCIGIGVGHQIARFPQLPNDNITWAFIRGYFDCCGTIISQKKSNTPECWINCRNIPILRDIGNFCSIPYTLRRNSLTYKGTNCIDFLGRLYMTNIKYMMNNKFQIYIGWLGVDYAEKNLPKCRIFKTDDNAILPMKSKESDVGYDMSVIKVAKRLNKHTCLYDTGIKMSIAHGYYAEIVPRSSLSKSGYMMTNSFGVIDRNYNGNILISLTQYDDDAPLIEFPFRCCQIIFRKQIHMDLEETKTDFEETTRGDGGFGSTG